MVKLEALGYDIYENYDSKAVIAKKQEGSAIYYVAFYKESKSFETYGGAKGHRINNPIKKPLLDAIIEMFEILDFN